jgi:hypothetical protein
LALCGIAFAALFALGLVLGAAGDVDLSGTATEVASRYDDNQTVLLASERILVLAGFFLFAFVGGLGSAFSLLASLDFEFLVLAAIPFGILLAATAIVVRRTRLLPRWLGTAAGVLAVLFPMATIVKFAALLLYIPFLASVAVASVLLYGSSRATEGDASSGGAARGLVQGAPRSTIPGADG